MPDLLSVNKKIDLEQKDSNSLFLVDKYLNFIIIALVIMISVSGYFFFIGPQYNSIKEKEKQKKDKTDEIYKNKEILNNLEQLDKQYKSIKASDLEKVTSAIPKYENIEILISDLEAIVKKNGLLLKSINIIDAKKEKTDIFSKDVKEIMMANLPQDVEYVYINMSIAGVDYVGLKNLLKALESNQQLIDISKIDFNPKDSSASIFALTYYTK